MPSPRRVDRLQCLYKRRQLGRAEFRPARVFQRAANRSDVEAAITLQCGEDGLAIVRGVVMDRLTLADVARANGARSACELHAYGSLFRRALAGLAKRLGYAAGGERRPDNSKSVGRSGCNFSRFSGDFRE